jgi:nucleoside-diphosphate-sugar epimerase
VIAASDQYQSEISDPPTHRPQVGPAVLLTGATSQLGVFLIPRLVHEEYRVLALSRKVSRVADSNANPAWLSPADLTSTGGTETSNIALDSIEFLVSCGPLELAISAISRCKQLRRIVVFSTSSVYSKMASADLAEREQIAEILKFENILSVISDKAGIDLVILRPTLIYGCGLDQNISRLARWIRRFGWLPVAGSATGLRQPVHADDLAQLAVNALGAKVRLGLDSPACGGSTLSYREMVERIFDSQSRPVRVVGLPPRLLAWGLELMAFMRLTGRTNREMVTRQNVDLVFDDHEIKRVLNYQPRPFRPTPADFEIPEDAARYQLR